ncbi:MAG TPA: DEAD/DEAH box helicase, partial [Candidatus Cloacimonetes bacterium]|nr:DEAD/DEAH box helicase [Candidatus Cloacimonadota bacterium]
VDSGKSLCYLLPILHDFLKNHDMRALFLFPTKALAQDQKNNLQTLLTDLNEVSSRKQKAKLGIYDGDTPNEQRNIIRSKANFIFSNPDMLHLGILPHHTKWSDFFKNLSFIVIDEVHIYRGIFGSHFANVIRRLKRIADFYKSKPRFILTSATLSNATDFISNLLEENFVLIDKDGSPHGEKHFMIYNPPFVNRELGIRRSAMLETIRLANLIYQEKGQTLVFAQSRRMVELIVTYLHKNIKSPETIHGYRSGYLPSERRKIEQNFREGKIRTTVATNALELGIDIGGLDTVIICGYPGSIASTKQQSGRAGRKGSSSLSILVVSSNLLDQYLASHPEYLLENSPEQALINPDNPFILLHHLQCAVFEKPFLNTESFGKLTSKIVGEYLEILQKYGKLFSSKNTFYWKSSSYPADDISLRTVGANEYILQSEGKTIGIVDEGSAFWMTHPQAVYIHNGESYLVRNLDQKDHLVELEKRKVDYYTQSQSKTEFELLKLKKEKEIKGGKKYYGQLNVTDQVVGYKKMKWYSNEILGYENLDLPASQMVTYGYWFSLSEKMVKQLEESNLWKKKNDYGSDWKLISDHVRERDEYTCQNCQAIEKEKHFDVHHKIPFRSFVSKKEANKLDNLITLCPACHREAEKQIFIQSGLAGLSYLLGNIAPLFLMCDRKDIRVHQEFASKLAVKRPTIIFNDSIPGGIGLSEKLFKIHQKLLEEAFSVVSNCECKDGCPACVGPVAENGMGAKDEVLEMLRLLKH